MTESQSLVERLAGEAPGVTDVPFAVVSRDSPVRRRRVALLWAFSVLPALVCAITFLLFGWAAPFLFWDTPPNWAWWVSTPLYICLITPVFGGVIWVLNRAEAEDRRSQQL